LCPFSAFNQDLYFLFSIREICIWIDLFLTWQSHERFTLRSGSSLVFQKYFLRDFLAMFTVSSRNIKTRYDRNKNTIKLAIVTGQKKCCQLAKILHIMITFQPKLPVCRSDCFSYYLHLLSFLCHFQLRQKCLHHRNCHVPQPSVQPEGQRSKISGV
jgi:hypothetical protein